ncbi:MAG: MCE family protein [Saprospiraceae bacterium]|nr:MCE family protein [Saprospiraceae bacterium]
MLKISNETKIGLLAVAAILLAIWGFKFLKGINVLKTSQTYYIRYANVDQLRPSSPVLINGLQVGMVKDMYVDPEDDKTIVVVINIERALDIPKDAVAVVVSASLMGGKAIELDIPHPCSGDDCAEDGDYLQGRTKSFVESIVGNPAQFEAYLERINLIYDSIAQPGNPQGFGRTLVALQNSLDNIEVLTGKLNHLLDASTSGISATFANTAAITGNLRESNKSITDLLNNLNTFSTQLKGANLDQAGQKAAGTLDSVSAAAAGLQRTLVSAKGALARIDTLVAGLSSGEGTAGQMFTDPELYQNLVRTSRQLQLFLQDLRLNPKRYNTVKLKIFGKNKAPEYNNPLEDPAYQLLIDSLEADYRKRANQFKN